MDTGLGQDQGGKILEKVKDHSIKGTSGISTLCNAHALLKPDGLTFILVSCQFFRSCDHVLMSCTKHVLHKKL
jgi:hypothetical protein